MGCSVAHNIVIATARGGSHCSIPLASPSRISRRYASRIPCGGRATAVKLASLQLKPQIALPHQNEVDRVGRDVLAFERSLGEYPAPKSSIDRWKPYIHRGVRRGRGEAAALTKRCAISCDRGFDKTGEG